MGMAQPKDEEWRRSVTTKLSMLDVEISKTNFLLMLFVGILYQKLG